MVKLHRRSKLNASALQRAFRNAAGRRSFLPDEQRFIGEGLGGDVPTSGPGVLGRHDQNEFIEHSGRETFLARPDRRPADDPKIELTLSDSSLDGLRIGDL